MSDRKPGSSVAGTKPLIGRRAEYTIEEVLGKGGMGVVYAAHESRTGRKVAVKLLSNQSATERFEQEAVIGFCLAHPNLVKVLDVGMEGRTPFFVMEMLWGTTLEECLRGTQHQGWDSQEPLESSVSRTRWSIRVAIYIARGLATLHAHGIVHRDVKPGNIFLCHASEPAAEPKLLDFGIAKREHQRKLTRSEGALGTTSYMSPEQARDPSDVDERSDVYSLAAVLCEAIGMEPRFEYDADGLDGLNDICSPDLMRVLSKALRRERAERYGSVREFARALEPFSGGLHFEVEYPSDLRQMVKENAIPLKVLPWPRFRDLLEPIDNPQAARSYRLGSFLLTMLLLPALGIGFWFGRGRAPAGCQSPEEPSAIVMRATSSVASRTEVKNDIGQAPSSTADVGSDAAGSDAAGGNTARSGRPVAAVPQTLRDSGREGSRAGLRNTGPTGSAHPVLSPDASRETSAIVTRQADAGMTDPHVAPEVDTSPFPMRQFPRPARPSPGGQRTAMPPYKSEPDRHE